MVGLLGEVVEVDEGSDAGVAGSEGHGARGVVHLHCDDGGAPVEWVEAADGVARPETEGGAAGAAEEEEVGVVVEADGRAVGEGEGAGEGAVGGEGLVGGGGAVDELYETWVRGVEGHGAWPAGCVHE